jgi:hypothetical protein
MIHGYFISIFHQLEVPWIHHLVWWWK